ncbi:MAG TPA: hypothetical protein VJO33_01585 [Gemmatimonadaceae bacterium]|nr:hypothetical protein [Gemmatimonadaceae bacterium]
MDERSLSDFIDRIVRDAKISSMRERAELRRELQSHFAEAGTTPEALSTAVERFSSAALVSDQLEHIHRRSRFWAHLLRVVVAGAASTVAAVAIQIVANLRIDVQGNLVSLGPAFSRSAAFATMIVVMLVAAWELDIDALCARLERHPMRFLAILVALSTTMILFHAAIDSLVAPGRALVASAFDVVIWTCTIAILARTDRAFARVFIPVQR